MENGSPAERQMKMKGIERQNRKRKGDTEKGPLIMTGRGEKKLDKKTH